MALNPPSVIDRRGKQPLRNFDGSFASEWPLGDKPEPSTNPISDLSVTFGSTTASGTWTPNGQPESIKRRNVTASGSFAEIATSDGATGSFSDSGLTSDGNEYEYRVDTAAGLGNVVSGVTLAPAAFTEGNEITITSADAGFTFGSKPQAAPIFYWHGRDVWVNGVRRDDYDLVGDGDPVPYETGEVFGDQGFANDDVKVFSTDARPGTDLAIVLKHPQYFGKPAGHTYPLSFRTTYFSYRAKMEQNYLDFTVYKYDSITGTFTEGEEVTFSNGVETFGPVTLKGVDTAEVSITTTSGLGTVNADLPGTLTGSTSGATANITQYFGTSACKTHRFVDTIGDGTSSYSHVSSGNSFTVKVNDDTGAVTQYDETGVGNGGYHNFGFDTGEWELFETSDIFNGSEGYSFWHVSGPNGGKQYSNFIDTTPIDFTKFPRLLTFGADIGSGLSGLAAEFALSDVYFDSTCQRVFVSNSATYNATGKNIELQLPKQWSDTSITFQCIEGGVDTAQTLYLYVVDDLGRVNGVDVLAYQSGLDVAGIQL